MKSKAKFMSIMVFVLVLIFALMGNYAYSQDKYKIGVSVAYFNHPVYQLEMKGMQEMADKEGDVELIFLDGKNDAAEQSAHCDNFISQKVDGIILMPAVSDPMLPAIKRINAANIPLVIVDRKIWTRGTGAHWDAMVNWDMVLSGAIMGAQVVAAMAGQGNLVCIEGTPGAGSTIDKADAAYPIIKAFPDIKIIYQTQADFRRDTGLKVTEDVLARYPKGEIDCIWFMNDEMALGGIQAIKAAGRLGEFPLVAGDGDHEAMAALRNGELDYEFVFHPDDHAVAVLIMKSIIRGEKLDESVPFEWKGRTIPYVEGGFEGMPWIRPSCYWVDKTNMDLEENYGW